MKNEDAIKQRITYNKAGEGVAKKMVEELTAEVQEQFTTENFPLVMKWMTANVAWACHIARQEELNWVLE